MSEIKLKLKSRKVPDKSYIKSILETDDYIYPYIGPMLGIKNLLKPFIRDIPSVKEYIKHIHQKQKKAWKLSITSSISEADVRGMLVRELKVELSKLGLSRSGRKKELAARLIEALQSRNTTVRKSEVERKYIETVYQYCELVHLLHSAVKKGLIDIVKYIIEIDPNLIYAYDGEQTQPAWSYDRGFVTRKVASRFSSPPTVKNLDILKLLLSHSKLELDTFYNVRPSNPGEYEWYVTTLLYEATHMSMSSLFTTTWTEKGYSLDMVKWIIERAIEIYSKGKSGRHRIDGFKSLEDYLNYGDEVIIPKSWSNFEVSEDYYTVSTLDIMLGKLDNLVYPTDVMYPCEPLSSELLKCPQIKKQYVLLKDLIKLLIQNGAKISQDKLENFLYLTRDFDDIDAEHYIKINHWDKLVQSVTTVSGKREYYMKNKL